MKHYKKYIAVLLISLIVVSCNEVETEYYSTGKLKTEIEYSDNDKRTGYFKEFYQTGKLKVEYAFKSGEKEGLAKWYHDNGQVSTEVNYINGVENGILREFYEDGKLKAEGVMENGVENGLSQVWYISGQKLREVQFENGKKNGYFIEYFEDGKVAMNAIYENDTAIYYEKFNKDGSLEKEYRYMSLEQTKDTVVIGEDLEIRLKLFGPELKYENEVQVLLDELYDEEPFVKNLKKEILKFNKNGELIYVIDVPKNVGHYGLGVISYYKNGEVEPSKAWFKASGGFWVVDR